MCTHYIDLLQTQSKSKYPHRESYVRLRSRYFLEVRCSHYSCKHTCKKRIQIFCLALFNSQFLKELDPSKTTFTRVFLLCFLIPIALNFHSINSIQPLLSHVFHVPLLCRWSETVYFVIYLAFFPSPNGSSRMKMGHS